MKKTERLRLGVLLTTLAVVMGTVSLARAEGPNPEAADALFREARELMKQKAYDQACPKFSESYRLDPAAGTLYNLAECEQKRGRTASALQQWQELVDLFTREKKLTDKRFDEAKRRAEKLKKLVPTLSISIKADAPKDTIVLLDGVELRQGSLQTALPTNPGVHKLIARAPYRIDSVIDFELKEKDAKKFELTPGAEDPDRKPPVVTAAPAATTTAAPIDEKSTSQSNAPAEKEVPKATRSNSHTGAYIAFGIAGAGLVGTAITAGIVSSKASTVSDHCDSATKRCDSVGAEAASSGNTMVAVNTAMVAVSVVGIGAGLYLYFRAPGGTQTAVGIAPTHQGSQLSLSGRF